MGKEDKKVVEEIKRALGSWKSIFQTFGMIKDATSKAEEILCFELKSQQEHVKVKRRFKRYSEPTCLHYVTFDPSVLNSSQTEFCSMFTNLYSVQPHQEQV